MAPGNGEKLELKLGSKSLGITTKDLVSVLFMLGAFAGWWLTVQHLSAGQAQGFAALRQVLAQQQAHQATLIEKADMNRQELVDVLWRQNMMVHEQTVALRQAVADQTQELRELLAGRRPPPP